MIKILFVLILHFTLFASNILKINDDIKKVSTAPYTSYISDQNSSYNPIDILIHENLKKSPKDGQLGIKMGPIWSKTTLQNDSNNTRSFIVYNPLPGTNYLDLYLYKNNILDKTYLLGDMRVQEDRILVNRFSSFILLLKPNEKVTFISKIKNFSVINIGWIIEDNSLFNYHESRFLIVLSIIGGVFIIFIFLSFILYLFYKKITYVIIAVYLLYSIFYQFSIQGIFYILDIGINLKLNTIIPWIGPPLGASLLLLFAYYFFEMNLKYKKSSYILKFLLFCNILLFLCILYAFCINLNVFLLTSIITGPLYALNLLFLIIIGLYMKEIGSKYYLIGQSLMFIAVIINSLSIANVIDFDNSHRMLITIAVLIDVVLLFIAQSIKTYYSMQELSHAKTMLIEQSRFSSMGQAIGHITHQWKHPLTLLGTSVMLLETMLKHDKKNLISYLEKEILPLSESISHMKKTMTELSSFYSGNIKKTSFLPLETVNKVLGLIDAKIILKNTTIKLNINEDLKLYNYEHILSNILIVLIDNSLDAFNENTKNNQIIITLKNNNNQNILTYQDNAGGIKIKPIENIFKYFITSKNSKEGQGIGLAMVKMLIVDRLDGHITVKNEKYGVEFKIYF